MAKSKLGNILKNWQEPEAPNFKELSGRYVRLVRLSAADHADAFASRPTMGTIMCGITCLMVPLTHPLNIFALFPTLPANLIHISL